MNEQLQEISERIKNLKINISEKKEKCLRYRHNLTQKETYFEKEKRNNAQIF